MSATALLPGLQWRIWSGFRRDQAAHRTVADEIGATLRDVFGVWVPIAHDVGMMVKVRINEAGPGIFGGTASKTTLERSPGPFSAMFYKRWRLRWRCLDRCRRAHRW